jgi:hypothetical protein
MSTTYIRTLTTSLIAILNIFGFDIDEGFLFELLSFLVVTTMAGWELYRRYQEGGISPLGTRK